MLRAAASCSSRALIVRGCSGLVAAAAAAAAVYRAPPACAGRALADAEGPGAAQCGPMVAGRMRGLGLWSPGGEITVQPLKGGGSSESEGVFVIANETGAPAKTVSDQRVVFKRMKPDKLRVERMLAAQRAFEAVGVCPAVVAAGDNWWVEAFAGSVPERVPHRSPEHDRWVDRRAALAARLHRAPPAWFDPIRSKCIAANPVLAALPDDSALWPIAAYHSRALDRFTGDELRRLDAAVPRPLSVAGRRLVSVHADLHRQNLVEETPGGVLVAVDTEFACVSSAVQDLLYHMGPPSSRRAFAAAYLREAAKGVGAADAAGATDEMLLLETDLLAFDILVAGIVHFGVLRPVALSPEGVGWPERKALSYSKGLALLDALGEVARAVRADLDQRLESEEVAPAVAGSLCARLVDTVDSARFFWTESQWMFSVLT